MISDQPTTQRQQRLTRLQQAVGLATESVNPSSACIDQVPINDALTILHQSDAEAVAAVQQSHRQLSPLISAVVQQFQSNPKARLIYVGAGTSGRLGVLDAVECVPTFGMPPDKIVGVMAGGVQALHTAVEGSEDNAEQATADLVKLGLTPADTVIGISASGKAAYVRQALKDAKAAGCVTGSLTNNSQSPLLQLADYPVLLATGPEVITGSTRMKAGTAQKLALNAISTVLAIQTGHTYGNVMVNVQPTNEKLRDRAARIVSALANTTMETAAATLKQSAYNVKQAIVMVANAVSQTKASALLAQHNGKLAALIDTPEASDE